MMVRLVGDENALYVLTDRFTCCSREKVARVEAKCRGFIFVTK